MTQDDDLITSSEVAIILGLGARTVHRYAEDPEHELKPVQRVQGGPHGTLLFRRGDVMAYEQKRDAEQVPA